MTNSTLVGLFDDRDVAQNAVQDLVNAGVDRSKISVVANDASGHVQTSSVDSEGNLAAEGASAGISSGAVVGGVAGLLIGAGFTVLPIAGFLLAGPIAGLIAGAAAGAATGGIVGGLIGLGIPEEHAELYAEGVRRGGVLVTVQTDAGMEGQVRSILNRDGAVDVEERSADWRANGYTGYDANAKPYSDAEVVAERNRYATSSINSDWNDTANAPAPSADSTYANSTSTNSTYMDQASDVSTTGPAVAGTYASGSNATGTDVTGSTYGTQARGGLTDAVSTPMGSMSMGDSTRGSEFDNLSGDADYDRNYRSHFAQNNPTGNYEEYAPAYQYGRQIGSTGLGDWDANESTYRSDWESRNPGTWDKVKSSVRHAYDSAKNAVTGGSDGNRATLR